MAKITKPGKVENPEWWGTHRCDKCKCEFVLDATDEVNLFTRKDQIRNLEFSGGGLPTIKNDNYHFPCPQEGCGNMVDLGVRADI